MVDATPGESVYTVNQIVKGILNPAKIGGEINRWFSQLIFTRSRPPINFFEKDWDNLLILDACRYDLIQQFEFPDGDVGWAWSGGSNSQEFIKFSLQNGNLDDVVWVTANPWVSKQKSNILEVIDAWASHWDDDYGTVLPEDMNALAVEAAREFPDKRLVVHYMQPHYPFIGEFARENLPEYATFSGGGVINASASGLDIWNLLRQGEVNISSDVLWKAYNENLDVVLPHALELLDELSGKSVISADHGNEIGGKGFPIPVTIYGHPGGLRTRNLVKVPWIVFDAEDRKRIRSGTITETDSLDESKVIDRLRHLGYHE